MRNSLAEQGDGVTDGSRHGAVSAEESDASAYRSDLSPGASQPAVYFPVSTRKFIVMSVATGGLYELYWSYRNWDYIKRRDGLKIMPFWRAWFTLFFHYDLLKRMKGDLGSLALVDYSPGWLTRASRDGMSRRSRSSRLCG